MDRGTDRSLWNATLPALLGFFAKLARSRELLWSFSVKEIKIRYKQSLFGVAWALFVPVSMMLIFTFIFKRVARIELPEGVEYPVFAYCGLLPWTFFARSLTTSVTSLVTNRQLLTKVYFPRETIPVSKIVAAFVDYLIATLVLAGLIAGYGMRLHVSILVVPLVLTLQIVFTIGCALVLSMANLFYRDIQYVFQVVIQLWMFATSVVYPLDPEKLGPKLSFVLRLNPMTPILDAYREAIIWGRVPDLAPAIPALVVVLLVFWLGIVTFDRAQYLFAERS